MRAHSGLTFADGKHFGVATAQPIPGVKCNCSRDAHTIDECPMSAIEVADGPCATIWREFRVTTAHGLVHEMECLARATDELRLAFRQRERASSVGTPHDDERKHPRIVRQAALPCADG